MRRAGTKVAGNWQPGCMCYGIAVGTDAYVQHHLEAKVDEVSREVSRVREVLGPEKDSQAMWALLQCSLAHKLDWQLSLNYPLDIEAAASRLDSSVF